MIYLDSENLYMKFIYW